MVKLGSGAQRELRDYFLSRFTCYLVAQNGDPRKPEIAAAQTYFAVVPAHLKFTNSSKSKRSAWILDDSAESES
jgi:DNA-damage-inducible protein D